MSNEIKIQKYSHIGQTNTLFKHLDFPPLEFDDKMITDMDEEILFLLMWETHEFGCGRSGNEQLRKLWIERTERHLRSSMELA